MVIIIDEDGMIYRQEREKMDNFERFKNKIIIYAIIVMLVIAVISIPIVRAEWKYFLGLLLGTVVSIINLYLLAFECKQVVMTGNKFTSIWGYILRLFLFGIIFAICIKISLQCGLGSAIGIMTTKVSIFIVSLKRDKTAQNIERK